VTTGAATVEREGLSREELVQRWEGALRDPVLRELPYRLELNKWGHIEMTPPASPRHMDLAATLLALVREMLGGKALPECSIVTEEGIRVADVAWCSDEFVRGHVHEFESWAAALSTAPELCIEIKSPTNALGELREKLSLYLASGAREGWIVHPDGGIEILGPLGSLETSCFPVDLDRIRRALSRPVQ
jgi:Uma2 family endonuclease